MNDNFKVIYKILRALEASLDVETFDMSEISPERFKISETRRNKYLEMLCNAGYIDGIKFKTYIDGETEMINNGISITLKGLEFLTENTIMQRLYKLTKKAVDIIP